MGIKRKLGKLTEREITLEEAFFDFIGEKKALNKSPATIKSLEASFNKWQDYLEEAELSQDVKDVTSAYVYSFMNHCLNNEMKPTTLNHYLRDIRAFLYWCMEKGMVSDFKVKLAVEQQTIKETYTDEELQRLLARPSRKAAFVEWRTWAIVNWIIATGNRAATVCNIKIGDINFKKREVAINFTKNNKPELIPISTALFTAIREYMRKCRADATEDDYLFPNIGNEQLTVNALKQSLRNYNQSRDVEKTSVHALRHTFAKNWIRNTGDVFRLQKMLGHSTLEMTRRYVNMFSEDLKEGFDTYNPLDNLKKSASRTNRIKMVD